MTEQQILIPNLNEIMEEFAETIEDTIVEHAETVAAKEVQEQNVEPEVEKEGRKGKRVEEEEK